MKKLRKDEKLTLAQNERLVILSEECAEVIQIINKIQRHGYDNYHPDNPMQDNQFLLEKELGHGTYAINTLIDNNDVRGYKIAFQAKKKSQTIQQWLRYQKKGQ
jgi:hypothetical protein